MIKNKICDNLPKHLGIIMDGNGRWAKKRGLPRIAGHREGVKAISRVIDALLKFGVKAVTLFAFSTENWKRSQQEIDGIFDVVNDYIKNDGQKLLQKGVRITSIGDLSKFPQEMQNQLESIKAQSANNEKLIVNLALNYGGRDDIVQAVNKLIGVKKNITENDISQNLYTSFLPDPELVIRTSGEERISNFMIYQMAYSELYFTKVYWPDFGEKDLKKALKNYCKRDRRFGGIK